MAGSVQWMRKYGMIFLVIMIFSGGLSSVLGPPLNLVYRWMLGL